MSLRGTSSNDRALRVAVVGGGITGLAAAHRLASQSSSMQVTLFEASHRLGGIIRTEEADGFLMELGPDSFITNKPAAISLCEEIGFLDQLIPTDPQFRRSLVLKNGCPLPVPDGFMLMAPAKPWAIMTTPVLSLTGRLRLLAEAFIPRRSGTDDESLASFVRRRFGAEALNRLVQPLVGGIYTSDPEKLSLQATMPRFPEMEQKYGSVIRATLAQEKNRNSSDDASGSGARYGLFATAAKGLGDLVHALETWLSKSGQVTFRMGTPIHEIEQNAPTNTWQIQSGPGDTRDDFDAVIVTLPTYAAAGLFRQSMFHPLCKMLKAVQYASSAIVVSGHRVTDFRHPMDAFGLVVPAVEQRKILAVSMSSRKFPNRAPEGHILLRTFVGGAMQPELLEGSDEQITSMVHDELRQIFGMHTEPLFSEVMRYHQAMPQYHVGHLDQVARIETAQSQFSGLQLAGSAYHGVGIPDSIASGRSAADRILKAAANS
jgi:oxygen-dependent protoporphyrinogen oxidase